MLNYLNIKDANSAKKIILDSTDGEEFFLMVLSMHSEQYRLNKSLMFKKVAEAESGYYEKNKDQIHSELIAGSVQSWSVPKEFGECTLENVTKLFTEYPEIMEIVNVFVGNNNEFFAKKSKH